CRPKSDSERTRSRQDEWEQKKKQMMHLNFRFFVIVHLRFDEWRLPAQLRFMESCGGRIREGQQSVCRDSQHRLWRTSLAKIVHQMVENSKAPFFPASIAARFCAANTRQYEIFGTLALVCTSRADNRQRYVPHVA